MSKKHGSIAPRYVDGRYYSANSHLLPGSVCYVHEGCPPALDTASGRNRRRSKLRWRRQLTAAAAESSARRRDG